MTLYMVATGTMKSMVIITPQTLVGIHMALGSMVYQKVMMRCLAVLAMIYLPAMMVTINSTAEQAQTH